jgi:predicted MFS family arabinose efflux permease
MDYRGAILIAAAAALSVFGFQQANIWGWSNPAIGLCIAAGLALFVVFYRIEKGTDSPLINVSIFRIRAFLVENLVLFVSMLVFVPVFFFASEYAQIALAQKAQKAGLFLLYLFIGFVVAAQIGGRLLDKGGAKRPVAFGCAISAVGFGLWAGQVTSLKESSQIWYIIIAGFGLGMMLGPSSTDAVNRASRLSYGEATGITQTVRNYAASLGLAVLGTIQVSVFRSHLTDSLVDQGVPRAEATKAAAQAAQLGGGSRSSQPIEHFVRVDFAHATEVVLYCMCGIMAAAGLIAIRGLRRGVQEDMPGSELATDPAPAAGQE